jgi:hypothetical protein
MTWGACMSSFMNLACTKKEIDLSLFSFSEICRLKEQKLRRTSYMKYVVKYEEIPTKFTSYFSEF